MMKNSTNKSVNTADLELLQDPNATFIIINSDSSYSRHSRYSPYSSDSSGFDNIGLLFEKCIIENPDTKRKFKLISFKKQILRHTHLNDTVVHLLKMWRKLNQSEINPIVFNKQTDKKLMIFMKASQHGSIRDLIRRRGYLTEFEAKYFVVDIYFALDYLNYRGLRVEYFDSEDLGLDAEMRAKFDFLPYSKLLPDTEQSVAEKRDTSHLLPHKKQLIGPQSPLSVLQSKLKSHSKSLFICPDLSDPDAVDSWNVGLLLYQILEGRPLITAYDCRNKIKKGIIRFDRIKPGSPAADLIQKLLDYKSNSKNLTTKGTGIHLKQIFVHPFLSTGGQIPIMMPNTILYCPPSSSFQEKYHDIKQLLEMRISFLSEIKDTQKNQKYANFKSQSYVVHMAFDSPDYCIQPESIEKENDQFEATEDDKTPISKGRSHPSLMTDAMMLSFSNQIGFAKSQKRNGADSVNVFVTEFCDITSVFGYGYKMSNGFIGFYFNDRTLLLKKLNDQLLYYYNDAWELIIFKQDKITDTYDIRKKEYILDAYTKSIARYRRHPLHTSTEVEEDENHSQIVFIKQYVSIKHAKLLLLSNECLQARFIDKTGILCTKEDETYVYNRKDETFVKLDWDSNSNHVQGLNDEEIKVRVEYTRKLGKRLLEWQETRFVKDDLFDD